ncbi:tyrosine-type recombinase/integrase [Nocardioides sp. WG-D5]
MGKVKDGIVKRGNTWSYVIRVTDANGVSKPKWKGGFATAEEAKDARDEARVAARRGEFVHRKSTTVAEYLAQWLEAHRMEIRPKTAEDYRLMIARYIVPRLGKMRLQSVKPATLSTFYAYLLREGGKDGGPLSPRTVNYVHSVLRKALNDAVNTDQILASNPALKAKRPKSQGVTAVHDIWDAKQLARFLDAVAADRLGPFFRVAAYTGARRGELFYLQWSNVVLDGPDPHIWIRGSTAIVRGHRVDGGTKTGRARRVSIDAGTVAILRSHKERQEKERELVGASWPDNDRVFRMEMGTPLRTDLPGEIMRRVIKDLHTSKNPLPSIRLHDLRHVHATLLLKAGVPVHVVAARLGHRDPSMTLRVYAHVLSDQGASAAQTFADIFIEDDEDDSEDGNQ